MTALREIAETSMDRKHEIDTLRAENAKLREALENLGKVAKNSIGYGDGKLISRILLPTIQEALK